MTFIIEKNGQFERRTPKGNVAWGPNHFQPASTLTADERTLFGVHELVETERPSFNERTHYLVEATPQKVEGVWRQTWDVVELSDGDKAARLNSRKDAMVEAVIELRAQHLASGFDYDFGDARGVHRIGTTPADLIGWDEVSKLAGAFIALGDTQTKITIVTDTGPAEVTALEWQNVLVAAAQFRQPIWANSFILQAVIADADHAALDTINVNDGWP